MGSTTSRLGLPYPAGTDPADVPLWMQNLAVALDGMVTPTTHGPLSSRPVSSVASPGIADRQYFANDVDPRSVPDAQGTNGQFYRDSGTGWVAVGPFASKVMMGQFAMPSATGNFDTTTVPFQPKALEITYGANDDNDTSMSHGYGWATGPASRGCAFFRATSQSGGVYQRRTRTVLLIYIIDAAGGLVAQADFVSFLANGFRINFSTAPGGGYSCQWKVWG